MKLSDLKKKFEPYVSNDVGIDLGTGETLIYVRGKGIVLQEPSVVAVNKKTGQIVDIGAGALNMLGRTPEHISAIRPVVEGVISDFEMTEELLAYFLSKVHDLHAKKLIAPRVLVAVPSGITNVESRAVRDALKNAGAREVVVVEESIAGACGINLPVYEPVGNMIVDIGAGTTDIAIISLGGIVTSSKIKVAGDKFNQDIIRYVRDEFKVLIGEQTAERVKRSLASIGSKQGKEIAVKGRDLASGLPREVVLTQSDVREAITHSIDTLIHAIRAVLEAAPPEILSDITERGIFLIGGGALLPGLDALISEWTEIPVHVPHDPLSVVVRGTGVLLENLELHRGLFVDEEHALPIKI